MKKVWHKIEDHLPKKDITISGLSVDVIIIVSNFKNECEGYYDFDDHIWSRWDEETIPVNEKNVIAWRYK